MQYVLPEVRDQKSEDRFLNSEVGMRKSEKSGEAQSFKAKT